MKKTLHYCDTCGKETHEFRCFGEKDICALCQRLIITKVIENQLMNLRIWCQSCHGTGRIEDSDMEPHGRITRTYHECKECKL